VEFELQPSETESNGFEVRKENKKWMVVTLVQKLPVVN